MTFFDWYATSIWHDGESIMTFFISCGLGTSVGALVTHMHTNAHLLTMPDLISLEFGTGFVAPFQHFLFWVHTQIFALLKSTSSSL